MHTWVDLPDNPEKATQQFFAASITCSLGEGTNILFWWDKWLEGKSIKQLAPWMFNGVPKRIRNTRKVCDALQDDRWIHDITGSPAFRPAAGHPDHGRQAGPNHLALGCLRDLPFYISISGNVHMCSIDRARELSKTRAPPKAKFFMWLALLGRIWTNDRLNRHHMQNDGPCSYCSQVSEIIDHLLLGCTFSREIWLKLMRPSMNQHLTPGRDDCLSVWWTSSRKRLPKPLRKGFDGLVVLVCWELWKERNRCIFDKESRQPTQLLLHIRNEANMWITAGYRSLGSFFHHDNVDNM